MFDTVEAVDHNLLHLFLQKIAKRLVTSLGEDDDYGNSKRCSLGGVSEWILRTKCVVPTVSVL